MKQSLTYTQWISPQRKILLIVGLSILIIFFSADKSLGAVGLFKVYPTLGAVAALLLVITGFVYIKQWVFSLDYSRYLRHPILLIAFLSLIIYATLVIFLLIFFSSTYVSTDFIIWVTAFTLLLSPAIWFLSEKYPYLWYSIIIAYWLLAFCFTVIALIWCVLSHYQIRAEFNWRDHHYFAVEHQGMLGAKSLRLYECNSVALFCDNVFYIGPNDYLLKLSGKSIQFGNDETANTLHITADGEIVYSVET